MSFSAWKDTIAFIILIIVLVIRPTGIFGEKEE
jgi:branched-subunit amino acid ABC-type transport system permease component